MARAIRSNSNISYSILSVGAFTATLAVRETSPAHAPKPRLLDQVRETVRARHYSRRTEKAYIHWIKNQALSALLFLYREVLSVELPWLDDVIRAKPPQHLPVVLTRDEVRAVLQRLDGAPRLMALQRYGAGFRLLECRRLRAKDVDFATNQIVIRHGKGGKDRVTMLPAAVKAALIAHLGHARKQHQADLRHGAGWVELPSALTRKYPNAGGD
jgi:integrase